MRNLAGTAEFWQCVQTTPASRVQECVSALLAPAGQKNVQIDLAKSIPKQIPVKLEVQPNYLWIVVGFIVGYLAK